MKSVFIKRILVGFFALALTSCDDIGEINMPHVFSGNEVPPEALAVPRIVTVPPPVDPNTPYPLLGTVPMRPPNFTPRPLIQQTFQQMENDRANAFAKKQEVEDEDPAVSPGGEAGASSEKVSSEKPSGSEMPSAPSDGSSSPSEILSASPEPEKAPTPISTP